ncbi:MAG: hypothetical protein KDK33_20710, partial [Leptospiraceae bacterium]|nr:hypothetical protein [Leptospiraceae bacterium]
VADRSFFATNRSNAVFQENHLLRMLSLHSDVRISDGQRSRSLRPSFQSLPLLHSRRPVQAAYQSYSLVSASYPLLHPPRCAGLLPDLCKMNAMSPGAPEGTKEIPDLSLDEILARGTASSAEEEFVEFKASRETSRMASGAAIVFLAEGQRSYKFALPLPDSLGNRLAFMRRLHESFAPGNIYANGAFRIPNHPFDLKVQLVFRDESGIHNETILNRRFKEKEVLPRSHSMVATAWGLMPSWSEESFPASPGRSGFFVPSLILSGSDSLRATWQSSAGADFRVDSGEPSFWLSLAEGLQQLSATCTERYCILGV